MQKKRITLDIIKEFAEQQNLDSVAESFCLAKEILEKAIDNISSRNLILIPKENVLLKVVGPFSYGSSTQSSDIELVVAINSPQLELNSQAMVKDKFELLKSRIVTAWKNNTKSRRKKRREKKKLKRDRNLLILRNKINHQYDLNDFKNDLVTEIIQQLPNTCIVCNDDEEIKLIATQELGVNFVIRVGSLTSSENNVKIFNCQNNTFIEYKFSSMQKEINRLAKIHGESFMSLFRILNNLYYYFYKTQPNVFLIETVMLMIKDVKFFSSSNRIEKVFVSFLNYINYLLYNKPNIGEIISDYIDEKKVIYQLVAQVKDFLKKVLNYTI